MTQETNCPSTPDERSLQRVSCRRYEKGAWRDFTDVLACEVRVEIEIPGRARTSLWTVDGEFEHLVLGHALLDICRNDERPAIRERVGRKFTLSVTRSASIHRPPVVGPALSAEMLLQAMGDFMGLPGRWEETGCFHRAAFSLPDGDGFLHCVEDIGRHNCIDRLAGWALCQERSLAEGLLFISARATASLVLKAFKAGFTVVVSRSAVTTAGVELARKAGLTLLGFARNERFTVFTDPAGVFSDALPPSGKEAP